MKIGQVDFDTYFNHYPDKDGPVYISVMDNNIWEPGVYGWELV